MADDILNILDSEIIAIDEGPVKWAKQQQSTSMDLEAFRRGVIEKFADVGFLANVLCYETTEKGVYAFDFEIYGRTERKEFDFDRMVHEVTSNLLDDPDQEKGFIASPMGAEAAAAQHRHKH